MRLILVSLLVAVPIAYVVADRWLQDFAHRIVPGPGVFILAGLLALGLALATVSALAIKVARTSPVNSLRHE